MKHTDKIKELEERIRALEARPVYVPIYITQPALVPVQQPLYPQWWNPLQYPRWGSVAAGGTQALTNNYEVHQ